MRELPYPKIVPAVDIPLHNISISLGKERLEAMRFADLCALLVACLFVLLVMAMLGVKQVCQLANLLLLVNDPDLEIVQVSVMELLLEFVEGILAMRLGIWLTAWLGNTSCHGSGFVRLCFSAYAESGKERIVIRQLNDGEGRATWR